MDTEERAAFYQEISNRGILLYLHEDGEEGTHCVSKVATQADRLDHFTGELPQGATVLARVQAGPPAISNPPQISDLYQMMGDSIQISTSSLSMEPFTPAVMHDGVMPAEPLGPPSRVLFSNRDRAEGYVKSQIGWDWHPTVEQVLQAAPPPPTGKFSSFIMYNIGFGPQNLDLGEIEADDFQFAQSIAEDRAREHFAKYMPKEDYDQTKKTVRIRPLMPV